MKTLMTIVALGAALTFVSPVHAVSEAALLFLLVQPSPRANAMAGASVASTYHGPISNMLNPAHIGFVAADHRFDVEVFPSRTAWLPGFGIDDMYLRAGSVAVGWQSGSEKRHPFSIGIGYSRLFFNYGTQTITDETGPDPLGFFDSNENAHILTIGVAFDYFVKLGFGVNYKYIRSNLAPVGAGLNPGAGRATAHSVDIGLLAQLPVLRTFARAKPLRLGAFTPSLVASLGIVRANYGNAVSYLDAAQSDPQPRTARTGVGLSGGLLYENEAGAMRVFAFELLAEAEDLLVDRKPDGSFSYDTFSEINPFDNLLLGNSNDQVVTKRGWEVSFGDVFSFAGGSYEDVGGKVSYDTQGFGIGFTGILRLVALVSPDLLDSGFFRFLHDRVDVAYYHAEIDMQGSSFLGGTRFNSIRIRLF